jgi:hypothetical protein
VPAAISIEPMPAFCSAQSSALDAGFCAEHALVKNALEKTTQSIIRE